MEPNLSHSEIDRRIDSQAEHLARLAREAEVKAEAEREATKSKWQKLKETIINHLTNKKP